MGAGLMNRPAEEQSFEKPNILEAMGTMKPEPGIYLDVNELAERMQSVFTAVAVTPELDMSPEAKQAIRASFNEVTNDNGEGLQRWNDALAKLLVLDTNEEEDHAIYRLRDGLTKQEVENTLLLATKGPQN